MNHHENSENENQETPKEKRLVPKLHCEQDFQAPIRLGRLLIESFKINAIYPHEWGMSLAIEPSNLPRLDLRFDDNVREETPESGILSIEDEALARSFFAMLTRNAERLFEAGRA